MSTFCSPGRTVLWWFEGECSSHPHRIMHLIECFLSSWWNRSRVAFSVSLYLLSICQSGGLPLGVCFEVSNAVILACPPPCSRSLSLSTSLPPSLSTSWIEMQYTSNCSSSFPVLSFAGYRHLGFGKSLFCLKIWLFLPILFLHWNTVDEQHACVYFSSLQSFQ